MGFCKLSKIQEAVRVKFILCWSFMTCLVTVYMYRTSTGNCTKAIISCFIIALTFVGSLYAWRSNHHRDHPSTIRKRCISVFIITLLSPILVYLFTTDVHSSVLTNTQTSISILHLLGLRFSGAVSALILPVILTMVLFAGPLVLRALDGVVWHYLERTYWTSNCRNLIWLRNHIVAPFSEEFSFRACMLPLLFSCFGKSTAIIICPLFFGVAHLHHLIERITLGGDIRRAVLETLFQFTYTTIFGAYSAFLFLRTGHFLAPFAVHSFCNHMGFPDFEEIFEYKQPKRSIILITFLIGFIAWCLLLFPLTDPHLYSNNIY